MLLYGPKTKSLRHRPHNDGLAAQSAVLHDRRDCICRYRPYSAGVGIGMPWADNLPAPAITSANDTETRDPGISCWFADLRAKKHPVGATMVFTERWTKKWVGKIF